MKHSLLLCFVVAALGACASTAGAEPYWIAYEGNDYPENEGWDRIYGDEYGPGHGGAERSIEDGVLTLDGRRHHAIVDFYEIRREIDPSPGETFVMQWRVRASGMTGDDGDPGVTLSSDEDRIVSFRYTNNTVYSSFEDGVSAPLSPGDFHEFEFVSSDMLTYELFIDGISSLAGEFWDPAVTARRVTWGDGVQGVSSLSEWDYFRFGVVPEPASLSLAVVMMLCCKRIRLQCLGNEWSEKEIGNAAKYVDNMDDWNVRYKRGIGKQLDIRGQRLGCLERLSHLPGRSAHRDQAAGRRDVRFYATDDSDPDGLGVINSITVYSGWQGSGTLRVMVWGPTNGQYGARDIGKIDLSTYYLTTTQIAGVWIKGNLGYGGYSLADAVTTGIFIEGDLLSRLVVSSCAVDVEIDGSVYNDLSLGNMTGDVAIGGNLYDGITFSRNGTTQVLGSGPHTGGGGCGDYPFSGNVTINGPLSGNLIFRDEMTGTVSVNGAFSGLFQARDVFSGTVHIQGDASPGSGNPIFAVWHDLGGRILVDGGLSGQINIVGNLDGRIDINGNISNAGQIDIGGAVSQTDPVTPAIHVQGALQDTGTIAVPRIRVVGALAGVIAIDGGLENVTTNGPEIQVGDIDTDNLGAIAIDYDGWDEDDDWDPNATIQVGETDLYSGNTPDARVYRISSCRGDLDNDDSEDIYDWNALNVLLNDVADYASGFPGLYESRAFHADVDELNGINQADADLLDWMLDIDCTNCAESIDKDACNADLDGAGGVNLGDLAALLGNYGLTNGATREQGDIEPFEGDGDVDLSDLAALLGVYGLPCGCFTSVTPGYRQLLLTTYVTVSVAAVDTGGYTGGGFVGEVDHFVFDLKITVTSPSTDDWLVGGAAVAAGNGATFLLSSSANTPNQYATFVAAPWTSLPGSATANVVGGYDPAGTQAFTTTSVNLGWYDTNTASNDGPATILRLVIDVSAVDDADVSSGFGSVYFSTTGPTDVDDILVAELSSGVGTKLTGSNLQTRAGSFYVKGEQKKATRQQGNEG